jgi:PAS domain S-box-containing protein
VRTLGIITDITERKLADQRLRESEERYRMALETGRLGAFDWDIPADIVHWDDRSLATLGLEPGTVLDFKSAMAFSHPDDRASIESAVAHALDPKFGKSFMQEWRAVGPDGGVRWMETQGQALFTGEGEERRAHRLIGTVRDVTRRKAAESEFAESEARFRSTFENAAVGIAHVARDGRWLRVNDKLCQILGYTRDELLTRTVEEITHGEDIADGKIGTDRLLAGEIPSFTIQQRVTRKDGGTIWAAATISLAGKSDGSPDYFIAVIEDITKDEEAEAALAASEAKLRLILDAAQMGIFEMDFSTGFAEIDAQEARLLGLEREARRVAIADVHRRIHPDDLAIKKTLQAVSEPVGEPLQAEFRYRLADGTERWLASHSLALIDSETGSKRIVGVNFDVTERKRSEETRQLLTHELDHRVKNTLATVLAIANQTLRQTRDPQTFVTSFEGRVRALARSHALLTRTSWSGADLAGLIGEQLAVGDPPHPQITIGGPDITLEPQTALHLALVLHELGTNARKHGALTSPAGRVAVTWTRTEEEGRPLLQLKWEESGGPDVTPPQNKGFGLSLIEGSLRGKIDANVDLRFEKSGVVCLIDIPLAEDK